VKSPQRPGRKVSSSMTRGPGARNDSLEDGHGHAHSAEIVVQSLLVEWLQGLDRVSEFINSIDSYWKQLGFPTLLASQWI
jgi:hypothetical protein